MIAYTGIETVSNLAEEARDPRRTIPGSIRLVAIAVFAIYFTLPLVALSALPVYKDAAGSTSRSSARPPPIGFENDPVLGLVENLGLHGGGALRGEGLRRRPRGDDPLHRHERRRDRRLADHVLDVEPPAAAGGVPAAAPEVQDAVAGAARVRGRSSRSSSCCPGNVDFIGRMYAFGAMLSFTIAHAAVIQLRRKPPPVEEPYRVRPNCGSGASSWPLFAIFGGLGTGLAWLVVVVQDAPTRYAGLRLARGRLRLLRLYRRRHRTRRSARPCSRRSSSGPAIALEYRSILVPIVSGRGVARGDRPRSAPGGGARRDDRRAACDRRADGAAARRADCREQELEADRLLDEARARGRAYGVRMIDRVVRARQPGAAIVEEAERRQSEIVVLGAPRGRHTRRSSGQTVDYVLKKAPCRVMVAAGKAGRVSALRGLDR